MPQTRTIKEILKRGENIACFARHRTRYSPFEHHPDDSQLLPSRRAHSGPCRESSSERDNQQHVAPQILRRPVSLASTLEAQYTLSSPFYPCQVQSEVQLMSWPAPNDAAYGCYGNPRGQPNNNNVMWGPPEASLSRVEDLF